LQKSKKARFIEELQDRIRHSTAMFFIDFAGITGNEFSILRREGRARNLRVKVVKNRLAKRALAACGVPDAVAQFLVGSTAIIFSAADPTAPAQLLKGVKERQGNLKFKGAYLEQRIFAASDFDFLTSLPTKEELRKELLGVLAGHIYGLVMVLGGPLEQLIGILGELEKKKVNQAEAMGGKCSEA